MDMRAAALSAFIVAALAGCAAQPALMKQTASGRPEAWFRGASAPDIRNKMAAACSMSGANVSSDEFTVTCSRTNDSMRGIMAQAMLGNACSNSPIERVIFTFNQLGQDVFVTARGMMQINKCFGEVQTVDYDNNNFRNEVQRGLDAAVAKYEAGGGAATYVPPPAPIIESPKAPSTSAPYESDPAKRCDACQRIRP
ncbi:MAG TPA: hypothetical protein VLC71_06060 [Thermomonas sp.]|nr:hypothetical protein [Thermomonas sp.]